MNQIAKPGLVTVVVNESSGAGRAGRKIGWIARELRRRLASSEVRVVRSKAYAHAEALMRGAALQARDGDAVIVVGGDGMAHLGVNACAGTEATLGIIPAGTGNDFARGVGVPTDLTRALDVIEQGYAHVVDLTRVSNLDHAERYVGAVVSTGYDARVNLKTNRARLRFGPLSYGYIALRELAEFDPLKYRLRIDGVERRHEAMLVAVANTGLFGGGMQIAPDADPADGLLDVTIVHPVSRLTLLRLLPQLYSGKFVRHPAVERLLAHEVHIAGDGLFVMGDGEELGGVPVQISVAPGSLRIFVNGVAHG
ncbi:MAG: diacylglycerol/lipid kinase family protein [Arachnia sp.]